MALQVNNASSQWECEKIEDITDEQLETTFRTNIFSMFYMARYSGSGQLRVLVKTSHSDLPRICTERR